MGPLHTDSVNHYIDSMAAYLTESRIRNFQKWPIIGEYVNWNAFVGATYEEDLAFLKDYIAQRSIWMDNNLPGVCDLSTEEVEFTPQYHKVWPNPMKEGGYVGYTLFENQQIEFELRDISGRIVFSENFGFKTQGEHANSLELSFLATGNYLYVLKGNGQQLFTGKILVR
jgi:hypothetical protein